MKVQVLRGSKQQIAETVVAIPDEIRQAVIFVEEPSDLDQEATGKDIFAEMEPFMVKAGGADYSRETLVQHE